MYIIFETQTQNSKLKTQNSKLKFTFLIFQSQLDCLFGTP